MKKQAAGLVIVFSCFMFIAAGCAKQGLVKNEEAPAATGQSNAEQSKAEVEKPAALIKESIAADRISVKESAVLEPIPNAGKIKAAFEVVYFDFDSYLLSQPARASLARNAEIMKNDLVASVRIEGNCDERGSDEYNLALGERRARSAMQYLVTMGVPENRLSVISYGKEKPAVLGHDEDSWAKNRRDEFVITKR